LELANRHPRVDILKPGPGVGGHCIAVDPWFIADSAPAETTLIQAARQVNDAKPDHVVEAIKKAAEAFSVPRIACLGLAYKADIDDLRESPAVKIVKSLALDRIGEVLIVEPHIRALPEELKNLSGLKLVEMDAALDRSGIVVLLVDHQPFKAIDRARLQGKVVIDTRGVWR
jgi:UDP-N-acetyl-D-mannosaminuronic acid dehydrogenase